MSIKITLPLIASAALALSATGGAPLPDVPPEVASGSAVPTSFVWGDYDADGLADVYVLGGLGSGVLLRNLGDGRLLDVTADAGLAEVPNPTLALWEDYDGDGLQDLLLGTARGALLFRNAGSVFVGGTRIFSNSSATTGVLLAAGGGSWTTLSDKDAKENVEPVDGEDVLERLADIPIATWNYKAQDDGIRHMGPMAQDFYAAFGLGLGDETIDTIDPDGVALAAIQALNARDVELESRLARKDAEIEALRAELALIKATLETNVTDRSSMAETEARGL